jgi:hypothetical protein
MKRVFIALGVAMFLAGGAQAREVAYCTAGFDIQVVSGDKAVCQKRENAEVRLGNRNCPPLSSYRSNNDEANDGGDKCVTGPGGLADVPAVLCEVDPTFFGQGAKTKNVRNGRDYCYKTEARTVYGDVRTRME